MSLVCPVTGQPLSPSGDLLAAEGVSYPVVSGVPDLRVQRPFGAHFQRRHDFGTPHPSMREFTEQGIVWFGAYPFAVGSYENELSQKGGSGAASSFLARRAKRQAENKAIRVQAQLLDKAAAHFGTAAEKIDFGSLPYGPSYGQSLSLLLARDLFWDHVDISGDAVEVGTHNGIAARYLWDCSKFAYGVEFVHPTLVNPNNQYAHQALVAADVVQLPFGDQSLDLVVSNQTMPCCYASIADILREVRRVLRPGGRFAFTGHGPAWLSLMSGDSILGDLMPASSARAFNDVRASYMAHLYSADEWQRLLGDYGFKVTQMRGYGCRTAAQVAEVFRTYENCGLGLLFVEPRHAERMNSLFNALAAHEFEAASTEWDSTQQVDFGIEATLNP